MGLLSFYTSCEQGTDYSLFWAVFKNIYTALVEPMSPSKAKDRHVDCPV